MDLGTRLDVNVVHACQDGGRQFASEGVPDTVLHLLLGVPGSGHLHAHALLAVHALACRG